MPMQVRTLDMLFRIKVHVLMNIIMVLPLEPWRYSTPFFGATAICTTKIGVFGTTQLLGTELELTGADLADCMKDTDINLYQVTSIRIPNQ